MSSVTVSTLKQKCKQYKPDITEYMNCRFINETIHNKLREHANIPSTIITGGVWQTRSKREEHAYLTIDSKYITGMDTNSEIIVDGAIKQFNKSNTADVWVTLGNKQSLPDVAVLTGREQHDWYSYYLEEQP